MLILIRSADVLVIEPKTAVFPDATASSNLASATFLSSIFVSRAVLEPSLSVNSQTILDITEDISFGKKKMVSIGDSLKFT